MIILNKKKFAESETEFTDSLFTHDGTCIGYAVRYKRKINLYDSQKNLIGVITNRVLASAHKRESGYFYNYETPKILGDYDSYSQHEDIIKLEAAPFDYSSQKAVYK